MSDRVTAPGTGTPLAFDVNPSDGNDYALIKLVFGAQHADYFDVTKSNGLPTQQSGGNIADASINAPGLGTLGSLLGTIAVNAARLGAMVQNQDVTVAYVVLDDGASGTPTVFALDPAAVKGQPGGSWDTGALLHRGRIRIYGTSGSQIAAGQL